MALVSLPLGNLCPAGRQALICFLISAVVFTLSFFSSTVFGFTSELVGLTLWGPALYFCLFNFFLRYCYQGFTYEVSIRSTFLGCVFAIGLYVSTFGDGWRLFGIYTMFLSMFHFSEFLGMAISNPRTLTVDSFILNHSMHYIIAAISSWVEWFIEYYFFPDMKTCYWLASLGVIMCLGGEMLRKAAMLTARTNFNHIVQFEKQPDHQLVTHGVYAICRHPSYAGWFYWSIGTQIILLNPICAVLYTVASWSFFRDRVFIEESTLLTFFGNQYADYQGKVSVGLPLIYGYHLEDEYEIMSSAHSSESQSEHDSDSSLGYHRQDPDRKTN